jgi:hypothetical protein
MARRRVGSAGARALAAAPTLAAALPALAPTPYGPRLAGAADLAAAQHGLAATVLWDLRVLAGWLPRRGGDRVRVLAGWFEIADVEAVLARVAGDPAPAGPAFRLGGLATVPRLEEAGSPAALRALLAASPWGDPGGETAREVAPALRLVWAERVAAAAPAARPWALGGAALLVARELFLAGRALPDAAARAARRLLGARAAEAGSLADLAAALPRAARWALDGVTEPAALWRAEFRWWARVEGDALALVRRPGFDLDPVVGAVAAAAVDAWRVGAALETAGRGGAALEVFDALA